MTPLIRIGLYALLVLAIFGSGYWKGYSPEHEKHLNDKAAASAFKAQVAANGIAAQKAAHDIESKHAADIAQQEATYEKTIAQLKSDSAAYIASLRRDYASHSTTSNGLSGPTLAAAVGNAACSGDEFSRRMEIVEERLVTRILGPAQQQTDELTTLQDAWPK